MQFLRKVNRDLRGAREFVRGLVSTDHPLLVHIVPIRRCNIDCAYCNEYDKTSEPLPLDVLRGRIDRLKALGTSIVAFSGGEPMLHPDMINKAVAPLIEDNTIQVVNLMAALK